MAASMGLANPVLSLYVKGFTESTFLVGFFFTTFALGRTLVTLPASHASDRWGRKLPIVSGALIEAVGSLGIAFAPTYQILILTRLVQGIGSGVYTSGAFLVVADLTTTQERGRVNSLFQGSILLGLTISPVIGGIMAKQLGLRAPIVLGAFTGLVAALLVFIRFPSALGKTNLRQSEPARVEQPAQEAEAVHEKILNPNFILITLAAFFIFVARAGSRDTLLPLLGHDMLGLDESVLGLLFTLIALFNLITIPLAGYISDSRGRKPAVSLGLALNGLALLLIAASHSQSIFFLGSLLLGAGKGFGEPTTVVYVTDVSPSKRYGTSFGLFLTLRDMGLLVGPVALGKLADLVDLRFPLFINGFSMLALTLVFSVLAAETLKKPARQTLEGEEAIY